MRRCNRCPTSIIYWRSTIYNKLPGNDCSFLFLQPGMPLFAVSSISSSVLCLCFTVCVSSQPIIQLDNQESRCLCISSDSTENLHIIFFWTFYIAPLQSIYGCLLVRFQVCLLVCMFERISDYVSLCSFVCLLACASVCIYMYLL